MRGEAPAEQHEPAAPLMGATTTSNAMGDIRQPRSSRPFRTFSFPEDFAAEIMAEPDWCASNFTERDLTFGMTTVMLRDELESSKEKVPQMALLRRSLVMIGGKKGLDYTLVDDWLNAIGPKGRGVVSGIFQELNAAGDSVGKSMMAASGGWST
jgi:hypothetical protein